MSQSEVTATTANSETTKVIIPAKWLPTLFAGVAGLLFGGGGGSIITNQDTLTKEDVNEIVTNIIDEKFEDYEKVQELQIKMLTSELKREIGYLKEEVKKLDNER